MKNYYSFMAKLPYSASVLCRKIIRIPAFLILVGLLLAPFLGSGQAILVEDFSYADGSLLTDNGWTAHSAGGTDPITVTSPSTISYSGYLSSGIGGEVDLVSSGEDDNRQFTEQTTGTIYFSFLVNVSYASTNGDYFFHIGPTDLSTTFRGRVFVKSVGSDLNFGIAQTNGTPFYSSTAYSLNTTHLIVLKYEFISGSANDVASIYINPPLNAPVPTSGWIVNIDTPSDLVNAGSIALRQGSNTPALKLDGIRVSTDWADIVGVATMPSLSVDPSSLSGFTYTEGSGPSTSQTYSLSGSNLTGAPDNIVVACATNYEVSLDNSTFSGSVNVPYTTATLDPTTIYVRLEAGLSAGTYNSEIVSNSGGGATAQEVTCDGFVVGAQTTYTWTGTTDDDWQVATNWSPTRTSPAINDKLQFNDGGTYTITNVPAETVAQLTVSAGSKITLEAAAASVLTFMGDTGDDLTINGSGSELNISGTNALSILLSTGSTGLINGSMTFAGAAHKLRADDASAITFANGSTFTTGTGLSGNVFGNTSPGSVVFQSGSTYIHGAGSNPFATNPAVVIFQTGSLFKLVANLTPSFSGRTYADFELDADGVTISTSGSNAVSIDNLTVTNGTLNFNMTGTPGHSIKGNISIANGAALNFTPSGAGTVNINGTGAQGIAGAGTIGSNSNSTINIDNAAGVTLNTSATLNNISIANGTFTVASGASLITTGTVPTSVIVERYVGAWVDDLHGWHFLSSPVTSQAIDPAFTDPTPANYDFYQWDEVGNIWLNQKEVANGITSFNPGIGYLVAYMNAGAKQFDGTLNTADVAVSNLTISGGVNSGWNLAGNPFPCALVWNDGVNWTVSSDIAATAKIWDEISAAYQDIAPDGIIPGLNGFMVQVVSGSPASMTIPLLARTHDATPWYKSTESSIKLIAYDRTNNTAQESIISVNDQATEAYDPTFDSRFLSGYAPQFYSVAGEEILSTNTLPNLDDGRFVEMGFVKNIGSEFSIGLDAETMIPGMVAYLTDKKTGVVTELSQNQEYTFTSEEGDEANRFRVHFGALGIDDPSSDLNYRIYANRGMINISSDETVDAEVMVINLLGQTVLQSRISGPSQTVIDASALQNGIYMVSITGTNQVISRKVFISR